MQQKIYKLIFLLLLVGCNNKATEEKIDSSTTYSQPGNAEKKQQEPNYNEDNLQYDQAFIDGLKKYKEPLKPIDNYILVNKDTFYFPEEIPVNIETVFKGTKDQKRYLLKVARVNLTTLTYTFHLSSKDNATIIEKAGKATLGSLFFLGSETDTDDKTDEEYLSTEYWDYSDGCSFAIRIGGKDDDGKLRAKVKLNCKSKKFKTVGLEENPTMRTE
jgi:hypothetical protein